MKSIFLVIVAGLCTTGESGLFYNEKPCDQLSTYLDVRNKEHNNVVNACKDIQQKGISQAPGCFYYLAPALGRQKIDALTGQRASLKTCSDLNTNLNYQKEVESLTCNAENKKNLCEHQQQMTCKQQLNYYKRYCNGLKK